MGVTTAKSFLPNETTAVAPNGNIFFLSDIAHNHLRLTQLREVIWTGYEPTGKVVGKLKFPPGTNTLPIVNSFFSKSYNKPFVEVDSPDGKYTLRAELNKQNFDLTPLNNLPTASEVRKGAEDKSAEANYVHDLEGKGMLEKMMYSIFGMKWKRNAAIAALGISTVIYFTRKKR